MGRPQAVQLDPLVRKILSQSGQSLDVPEGLPGETGSLYPDLLAAGPEASPTCGCNSTWMGTPSARPP